MRISDRSTFCDIMRSMFRLYGGKTVNEQTIDDYWMFIAAQVKDIDTLREAVYEAVAASPQWQPSAPDIVSRAKSMTRVQQMQEESSKALRLVQGDGRSAYKQLAEKAGMDPNEERYERNIEKVGGILSMLNGKMG